MQTNVEDLATLTPAETIQGQMQASMNVSKTL
jgi:hypothetical protein